MGTDQTVLLTPQFSNSHFFIELQHPKITIKYKFTGLNHLNLIIHFHYTVQPFTNYPVP